MRLLFQVEAVNKVAHFPSDIERNENCEKCWSTSDDRDGFPKSHSRLSCTGGDRSQDRVRTPADEASSCCCEEPNAADQ